MSEPSVISVNPGKKTMGAIKEEGRRYDRIDTQIVATIAQVTRFKNVINLITGIDTQSNMCKSASLAFSRLLLGGAITAFGIIYFYSMPIIIAIVTLAVGISTTLGLGMRIISFTSAIFFGFITAEEMFPMLPGIVTAVGMLIESTIGPGIYSLDQLFRRALIRARRRNTRNKLQRENYREINYKSYISNL